MSGDAADADRLGECEPPNLGCSALQSRLDACTRCGVF
jgi:hypothetical protein